MSFSQRYCLLIRFWAIPAYLTAKHTMASHRSTDFFFFSESRIETVSSHPHLPVYHFKIKVFFPRQIDVLRFLICLRSLIALSLSRTLQKCLQGPLFFFFAFFFCFFCILIFIKRDPVNPDLSLSSLPCCRKLRDVPWCLTEPCFTHTWQPHG